MLKIYDMDTNRYNEFYGKEKKVESSSKKKTSSKKDIDVDIIKNAETTLLPNQTDIMRPDEPEDPRIAGIKFLNETTPDKSGRNPLDMNTKITLEERNAVVIENKLAELGAIDPDWQVSDNVKRLAPSVNGWAREMNRDILAYDPERMEASRQEKSSTNIIKKMLFRKPKNETVR